MRDAQSGRVLVRLPVPLVFAVAWSGDGRLLAVTANHSQRRGVIELYDAVSCARLAALEGHDGPILSLAFNCAGTLLASQSWDITFRLWDPRARRELVRGGVHAVGEVHFSPDDRLLGPFRDGSKLRLAAVADGRECRLIPGVRGPLAFGLG